MNNKTIKSMGILIQRSSHPASSLGEPDARIITHPVYLCPDCMRAARQESNRDLFRRKIDYVAVEIIRYCTRSGWALGR